MKADVHHPQVRPLQVLHIPHPQIHPAHQKRAQLGEINWRKFKVMIHMMIFRYENLTNLSYQI